MNKEFECAKGDWYAHDAWQFADREAAYKFSFNAGAAAGYTKGVTAMREKCAEVASNMECTRSLGCKPIAADIREIGVE